MDIKTVSLAGYSISDMTQAFNQAFKGIILSLSRKNLEGKF